MSEQVGELYVSIQVDTEALEQGFTTAQRLGQDAAGTMENAWTNQAAKGMERFTEAVADATANLTIYNQAIAGNSLNTFTTSVQGAETILNDISKELGTYTVETTSAKEASQQADEAAGNFFSTLAGSIPVVGDILSGVIDLATELGSTVSLPAELEVLIGYSDQTIESFQNLGVQADVVAAAFDTQSEHAKSLMATVEQLGFKEGKNTQEKQKLYSAMAQLNAIYPGLNLAIDEETGNLNKNIAAINSSAEAIQKRAKARAMEELMVESMKELIKLEAEGAVLAEERRIKIDEQTKAWTESGFAYKQGEEWYQTYGNTVVKNTQVVQAAIDAEEENKKQQEEATATVAALSEEYGKAAVEADAYTQATIGNSSAIQGNTVINNEHMAVLRNNMGEELGLMWEKLKAGEELSAAESSRLEQMQARVAAGQELTEHEQIVFNAGKDALLQIEQKKLEEYSRIGEEMISAATNRNQKINRADQLSFEEAKENQKSNLELAKEFNEDFEYLKAELPPIAQKYLAQMGINDARMLAEMVDLWKNGSQDQVMEYFNGMEEGIAIGTVSATDAITSSSGEIINAANSEMSYDAGVTAGANVTTGQADGITENEQLVKDAAVNTVTQTFEAMEDAAEEADFSGIGERIANSLANGLTISMPKVTRAGKRVADALKDSMRVRGTVTATPAGDTASIQVNWYDKGGYFDQAAVIGIAEKRPEFVGAAEDLETFITRAVNEAMVKIPAAVTRAVPGLDFPAMGGEVYNDYRTINLEVKPQQMTKEQTDYLIYKVNRELGKRLI